MLHAGLTIVFSCLLVFLILAGWLLVLNKGGVKKMPPSDESRLNRLSERTAISPLPLLGGVLSLGAILLFGITSGSILAAAFFRRVMFFVVTLAVGFYFLSRKPEGD